MRRKGYSLCQPLQGTPRPALLRLPADRDGVITQAQDFIDHHTLGDEPAPKIMIMHQLVTVLKDAEVEQE